MAILDRSIVQSSDDCWKSWNGSVWAFDTLSVNFLAGYYSSAYFKNGNGARFQNITIPKDAVIIAAYITIMSHTSQSLGTVRTRIKGEAADDAATFSDVADFDGRSKTAAVVDWDDISGWTVNIDYNSPEIKTIIQEIVNRGGWASGNALVIFWEDFENRSTNTDEVSRYGRSWDGLATEPRLHIRYAATQIGEIGSVIDTVQWRPIFCYLPFMTHATGDIYLIGNGSVFRVHSISIDSQGEISDALIDNLQLGPGGADGSCKEIIRVSGDVYAVAFLNANVWVKTFTCDSDGNIGAAEIDSIDLATAPTNATFGPYMLHVTGNVFAIAYTDDADDGWLKTITINDDGSIDEPALSSLEFEADRGRFLWLLSCGGTLYVWMSSSSASNRGIIRTLTIDASGNITSLAKEWLFETATNGYNGGVILPIGGNNYVIFYQGPSGDGWMKTCTIADNGVITPVDSWEFETTLAAKPHAVQVSRNQAGNGKVYCVVYGQDSTYQVTTIEVLNDGTITKSRRDSLILVAAENLSSPSIVRVAEGIYAVAYEDLTGANTGEAKSFDIVEFAGGSVGGINPVLQEVMSPGIEV